MEPKSQLKLNPDKIIPALNNELLEAKEEKKDDPEPKRNTKEALIDRILSICQEHNLELTVSNTKLKRMSKTALQKLLGELVEDLMKKQMAEAVHSPSPDQNVVALHTLRMLHDMCVTEIAAEHNVMQYIESPYARLGLAWTTGLVTSVRRSQPNNYQHYNQNLHYGSTRMGPQQNSQEDTVRSRTHRRPTSREEHRGGGPIVENVERL